MLLQFQNLFPVCPKNDWIVLNNTCYKFQKKTFFYHDAHEFCANNGGKNLESMKNSTYDLIYRTAKQKMPLNYGTWIDTNRSGECDIMILKDGQRNSEDCDQKHGFICQSEVNSYSIIQFQHKEFVALKNESFVVIIVERLFASWDQATMKWEITNQTAECNQEIKKCNGSISFNSGESTTKLKIPNVNSNNKERSFQIQLISPQNSDINVKLGNINKTLVRIISGNGTIQLDRKSYFGFENCGFVLISVVRLHGSAGEISVKWKANGYINQSGSLTFYDGDTLKSIQIDIIDDNEFKEEETFELGLFEATGGAKLGEVNKTKIIIEDNDGKKLYSHQT